MKGIRLYQIRVIIISISLVVCFLTGVVNGGEVPESIDFGRLLYEIHDLTGLSRWPDFEHTYLDGSDTPFFEGTRYDFMARKSVSLLKSADSKAGLGLTIARRAVEINSDQLELDSRLVQGATFRIEFLSTGESPQ